MNLKHGRMHIRADQHLRCVSAGCRNVGCPATPRRRLKHEFHSAVRERVWQALLDFKLTSLAFRLLFAQNFTRSFTSPKTLPTLLSQNRPIWRGCHASYQLPGTLITPMRLRVANPATLTHAPSSMIGRAAPYARTKF